MMTLLASTFMGAAAFLGSIFGQHDLGMMKNNTMPTPSERHGTTTPEHPWMMASSTSMGSPAVVGKVTSIDGMTFTMIGRGPKATATTTFTVDATSAKIYKKTASTTVATIASIKAGDMVFVTGTVHGTSIIAKVILDGLDPLRQALENAEKAGMGRDMKNMKGMASSTMKMHMEASSTLMRSRLEKPRLPETRTTVSPEHDN